LPCEYCRGPGRCCVFIVPVSNCFTTRCCWSPGDERTQVQIIIINCGGADSSQVKPKQKTSSSLRQDPHSRKMPDSSSAILGFLPDPLIWFPPLQLHSSSLLGDAAFPLVPAVYLSCRKKEINFLNLHSVS
ncbi:hypothetical protein ATANTOWER_009750, partial [Ataeniobius toweri]|nr:hypothetical protein [Ataeniobius toweri]